MSAQVPVPGHRYVPEIDALRAIAVLAVMAFHLDPDWIPGGYTGVDVFFVISGYVVTASMTRDLAPGLARFALAFYARRVIRILPALLVMLLATTAATVGFVPDTHLTTTIRDTAVAAIVGLSNWQLEQSAGAYFAPATEFNPFAHTWSLGVEEQFYLVFPLALYACTALDRHLRSRVRAGLLLLTVLIGLSIAWSAAESGAGANRAFYLLPGRFWELALGALLFLCHREGWLVARAGSTPDRMLAFPLCVIALGLWSSDARAFPMPWAMVPVAGTLAVLCIVAAPNDAPRGWRRLLRARPLVWIGLLSYSLYLWHWPVYVLMRWTTGLERIGQYAFALALTGALATGSYLLVERRVRRSSRVRGLRRGAVVAGGLVLASATYGLLDWAFDNRSRLSQSVVTRRPEAWWSGPWRPGEGDPAPNCGVSVSGAPRDGGTTTTYRHRGCSRGRIAATLYVVGDSHAASLGTLYSRLVQETGIDVVRYERPGCGVLTLLAPSEPRCEALLSGSLADIAARAGASDLVLLPSLRVKRLGTHWTHPPMDDALAAMTTPTAVAERRQALDEARRVVPLLLATRARVVITAPLPVFGAPAFRCADAFNARNPVCAAGSTLERTVLERHRAPVVESLRVLAREFPALEVWDPFPILCPGAVCEAMHGESPIFTDGDHLGPYGNMLLYADAVQLLAGRRPWP